MGEAGAGAGAPMELAGRAGRRDMSLHLIRLELLVLFGFFGGEDGDDSGRGDHGNEHESNDQIMHRKLHFSECGGQIPWQ